MILMHSKCFEFHFDFAFWVESSEVVFEFRDKKTEVREPDRVV